MGSTTDAIDAVVRAHRLRPQDVLRALRRLAGAEGSGTRCEYRCVRRPEVLGPHRTHPCRGYAELGVVDESGAVLGLYCGLHAQEVADGTPSHSLPRMGLVPVEVAVAALAQEPPAEVG